MLIDLLENSKKLNVLFLYIHIRLTGLKKD